MIRMMIYIAVICLLHVQYADAQGYSRTVGQKHFETSNHLGNVLATTTDRKLAEATASTVVAYESDVVSYGDYYPYGMLMEGRGGSEGYRFGFQGMERDDEVNDGKGNSHSTFYRQNDVRTGRWFSFDPKPTPSQSPYASMGNNPIMYTDVLGDTIRGTNVNSANRELKAIVDDFKLIDKNNSNGFSSLIKLEDDGRTFSKISEDDFVKAVLWYSEDQLALAYGYYLAINSSDLHEVDVISSRHGLDYEEKELTEKYNKSLEKKYQIKLTGKGTDIEKLFGGGVNFSDKANQTSTILLTDSGTSSVGELSAHEVLGHGLGRVNSSPTFNHQDAIQLTNLHRRAIMNATNHWRDGHDHGKDKIVLSEEAATGIPSYLKIPSRIRQKIYQKKLSPPVQKKISFDFNYKLW